MDPRSHTPYLLQLGHVDLSCLGWCERTHASPASHVLRWSMKNLHSSTPSEDLGLRHSVSPWGGRSAPRQEVVGSSSYDNIVAVPNPPRVMCL